MFQRPINVCHLGKYYPPAAGGIESHVQTLAHAQAALGASVRVICVNHRSRDGHDVTFSRYGATRTVEDADGPIRITRLGRSASVARFDVIPGLPRLLLDLQYSPVDVLHVHTPNPTMLLALAGLRLNKPLVITHHSDVINQRWLVHLMRPLERIVYGRASAVVCSSDAYATGSPVLQRFAEKRVTVPLGGMLTPFADPTAGALRAAAAWQEAAGGQPLWLAVGRCVYYKGLSTAIAALREVPGRLLLIGRGPLEERLRRQARDAGVLNRVIFHGRATDDELTGAYLAATALWFPSNARSEAFGLVQVEAMAAGCPVINTHLTGSGVPWVSLHGETGLTVPVNDAHALADAARRLLREPGLRARLSSRGRERALSEFTADRMAQRTLAVYAGVLRTAAASGRAVDAVAPPVPKLERWVRRFAPPSRRAPALASTDDSDEAVTA